eukprot:c16882_g1_i2 orf=444-2705(-)
MLWPQMEARSRKLGFGFPGYDGCFPKATRSSRGRGDHSMRKSIEASDLPKDMCFFELLATVAGQLLQEQNDESLTARSLIDLETPNVNVGSGIKSSTAYDIASHDLPHMTESESAIAGRENTTTANKDLKLHKHKMEACYEPSANSCLDNLDPSLPQEHDSKPLTKPVKAYSSRKRRNSGVFSCQGPANITSIGRLFKTEPGERVTPRSDQCTSKAQPDVPHEILTLCSMDLKETLSSTKHDVVDIEQPCIPTVARQCQEIDLLMQAPFQVDVESPPLVSSGSSEETSSPMEPKSYSTLAFESSRQDGGREEFSCWKAGDDDGNSSESTIPKNVLTKSSSMSYIRAMKARRCANGTAKKRASATSSKRKRHELEDGEKGHRDAVNSGEKVRIGRKKASKLPSVKDDVEQSNFCPLGMLVDSQQVHAPHTKLEREKISSPSDSPTTSSPSELEDSNVKLSIKSFMVPELMVDLPESATVANLKKAVMEAAMNLLGGGLCVRVLLQGKKVVDETESLLQAGISSGGKLDSLGFMLEPNPVPASASVEDTFLVLSHSTNQTPSRYPVLSKGSEINTGSFHVGTSEGLLEIDANSSGTEMQSTTVSPSKEDTLVHDSNGLVIPGPCALVLHSGQTNNGSNGLAVVPFGQSPGSIGANKRRIRRPFSVVEVEVLVQAVEKLGTGRWRDVKLHAFPQAKHRTYVDLKDKWKTLVHTASIAPHQRRGEPVPQALLDRVIQAHSYWTAQQAKQQSMETKVF